MPSLFTAGDLADLAQADSDIFATRLALANPAVSLTLSRLNTGTGLWVSLTAKTVLMIPPSSSGGGMSLIDGTFEGTDPFDVLTGDKFTLGSLKGEIQTVYPSRNGRRRADFLMDSGGRARLLAGGL